jgi:hypothetical protein
VRPIILHHGGPPVLGHEATQHDNIPPVGWSCGDVMLTLLAIATTVLIAFGLFVWLQGHRPA